MISTADIHAFTPFFMNASALEVRFESTLTTKDIDCRASSLVLGLSVL